jgi:DNA mismatch endonuclease (patch repair protein)
MDVVTREVRSRMMAAVPQTDTKPEIVVRQIIHSLGYRFRLHRKDLPGRPDVVLPRLGKVIFVHGCFWHRHGCRKTTTPKSNAHFWMTKFAENKARDRRVIRKLKRLGWTALIVWECQTIRLEWLRNRLARFLDENGGE